MIACNILHLTILGFAGALEKILRADPANVLVVTEHVPGARLFTSLTPPTLSVVR